MPKAELKRSPVQQIAALPIRRNKATGAIEVLMVTSRGKGKWLVPKGWEMKGKSPWAAARIEAREEAGAKGSMLRKAIGRYSYEKTRANGQAYPFEVRVYPMAVDSLKRRWKERRQRKRRWFSLDEAARRVEEKELSELLARLASHAVHILPQGFLKRL